MTPAQIVARTLIATDTCGSLCAVALAELVVAELEGAGHLPGDETEEGEQ